MGVHEPNPSGVRLIVPGCFAAETGATVKLLDLFGGKIPNGYDPPPPTRSDERRNVRGAVRGSGIMAWVVDGRCYSSPVEFHDASDSGAGMIIPLEVPEGQTVWLLLDDGADYRAVVRYCRQDGGGFRVGVRTIPEKRGTAAKADPATGFSMKWIDSWENLRTSPVSVDRSNSASLAVVAQQPVPCPAIVLLASEEDLCLAYGSNCQRQAPYRLQIEILPDTYVNY